MIYFVSVLGPQLFLFQSNWHWGNLLASLLSVGAWIGIAYIINASAFIDFDFYHVSATEPLLLLLGIDVTCGTVWLVFDVLGRLCRIAAHGSVI